MPFHEIHGRYFSAVAEILRHAVQGDLTPRSLREIVRERAFAESLISIPENLRSGAWPLITGDLRTPLKHAPDMPLTDLQRRWMKAILNDPRIRLFNPPAEGLEDVQPLYDPETFVYFDRYADGDPYDDPAYAAAFQTILTAIREKRRLHIEFTSYRGQQLSWNCAPHRLEYSSKDDKFRLITCSSPQRCSVNLARITRCELLDRYDPLLFPAPKPEKRALVLELCDERNALSMDDYRAAMTGVYTSCVTKGTLDESPMAYKSMDAIVSRIGPTVDILRRIRPIYNFKASN